eukprot:CAMPEP_0113875034 /NCGR_PEP_ID=MMETSP0780_2-20120614/4691_1 /TAXON_ID=652834 /ORGANISM="Palpitomonas bilix" /LENGTH=246 /DNA_ID=CAMNT_0000860925 /DNA_START=102 /DNA_END=842 /DNA_ORIENTATION=- /assembly_acc=CAM_ASM_000599
MVDEATKAAIKQLNEGPAFPLVGGRTLQVIKQKHETWRNTLLFLQHEGMPQLMEGKVVLDMGCGTGFILGMAAQYGAKKVAGIDVNETHCDLTKATLEANSVKAEDMLVVHNSVIDLKNEDWKGKIDVVCANLYFLPLPHKGAYLPDPELFCGEDGCDLLRMVVDTSTPWLSDNAIILMVVYDVCNPENLCKQFAEKGWTKHEVLEKRHWDMPFAVSDEGWAHLKKLGMDIETTAMDVYLYKFSKQ